MQISCPYYSLYSLKDYFDENLIVPDDELSIADGAIAPWHQMQNKHYTQVLEALSDHYDFSLETPYYKISDEVKKELMFGSGETEIEFKFHDGLRMQTVSKPFEGVIPYLERKLKEAGTDWIVEDCEKYQNVTRCRKCSGYRLRQEALCIQINGLNIADSSNRKNFTNYYK